MTQKSKHTDVDKESLRLEYCFDKGINFQDRIIQITGEIQDNSSFDWLDAALTEMERSSRKAITLKINSPGGSPYEALAMVDRIKESKCQIITKCYGHAMSAAILILASGDKRLMGKHAWFMHHEASYEAPLNNHSNVKDYVQQLEREEIQWNKTMAEFSNESEDFWRSASHKHDFYLTAKQCLELEIVDELF